ncbi:hypothetical protein [Promicromonospora sp. NPDC023987]|uniref:hypothetical protein n=1 Tax=Promicromonospora sp. NPDC023987 TaxID=3155360 RepID=UPI0033E0B045
MNQHRPDRPPVPGPRPADDTEYDQLAEQIGAALRAREPDAADTAAIAQQIAATIDTAADGRSGVVTPFVRRAGTFALTGVVASALGVVGAGAAAAANPFTGFAAAVDSVAHAVGVDWSSMPSGYTREQYEAFWGAGFTVTDQEELEELWNLDSTQTKARAGQAVLDGEQLPFEPGTHSGLPEPTNAERAAAIAFLEAGYTSEDAEQLAELWQVDMVEAKFRAGDMLLNGKTPPLP